MAPLFFVIMRLWRPWSAAQVAIKGKNGEKIARQAGNAGTTSKIVN
jgi:hypothetical protein